jgi:murein DD-endopeptidase MepM/ murein hydrolase activator NlpD
MPEAVEQAIRHQESVRHALTAYNRLAPPTSAGYSESTSPSGGKETSNLRIALMLALLVGLAITAAACSSGEGSPRVQVTPLTSTPTSSPEAEPTAGVTEVRGLLFPIEGACLPSNDTLMPNAVREYRDGIHEGVDFYGIDNCVSIVHGTPVRAVKEGRVIRATLDYHDLTWEELDALNERVALGGGNDPDVLDTYRGRQVWVDHGGGLVTRYAHLSGIAPGIAVGATVEAGQELGYVGDSGTPESLTAPGTEDHLHFEIRVGDHYLGQGLPPDEVRALYERAFSL